VQEINDDQYVFRNNDIYASVARRNEVFAKLEIFSLLSLWKNLDANIRSADSLNAFRSKLKLLYQPLTAPYYFKIGAIFSVLHHTRIIIAAI